MICTGLLEDGIRRWTYIVDVVVRNELNLHFSYTSPLSVILINVDGVVVCITHLKPCADLNKRFTLTLSLLYHYYVGKKKCVTAKLSNVHLLLCYARFSEANCA